MVAFVKRLSAGFLTALVLISLFSFNVSAASVETSSDAYTAPAGVTLSYRTRSYKNKFEKKYKKQGAVSGYVGKKNKRLASLQVKISSTTPGSVQYRTHAYKKSWGGWKSNGKTSGAKKQKLNQVQIRLTGELAEKYDIYYRVHVHEISNGWLSWAKNGETAGVKDYSFKIDAIQIVLTDKDAEAPGNIGNVTTKRNVALMNADTIKAEMTAKAQGMSSKTKWLILCDTKRFFAAVFKGSKGNWKLVRFIHVSVGKPSTPTRKGSFTIKNRKKKFYSGTVRCKYCTRYTKAYYFHSIPYTWDGKKVASGRLGFRITHGCIRMATDDAKYIYKKVPKKTKAYVY